MTKRLKIGIVLPGAPTYSETFFSSKIEGLEAEGHEVILFVGNRKNTNRKFRIKTSWPVTDSNIPLQIIYIFLAYIHLLITAPKRTIRFVKREIRDGEKLKSIFRKVYINAHILPHKLDWLHFGFATLAVKRENVANAIGAKMAVSFRGFDINIFPFKNKDAFSKVWKKVDKVHSISDNLYLKAVDLGLPEVVPWQKITPAIDVGIFCYNSDPSLKGLKILTVARLHWIKGLEYALEAMNLLKTRGVDFEYVIVGDGPDLERLLYATHQLGINKNVRFLGRKEPREIAVLMKEHSLYLQPSLQEGFCNAVLEAQASGMLCIATNAGGLTENVLHGKTGWLVNKRDSFEIAEAIEILMESRPSYQDALRKNAVERVKKNFSLEKQKSEFKEFYTL